MKKCSKCKQTKQINEFGKYKPSPDGKRSECKKCRNLRERIARYKSQGVSNEDMHKHLNRKKIMKQEKFKICKKCRKKKNKTEFVARKKSIDGYRHTCRECLRKEARIRDKQYRQLNPSFRLAKAFSSRIWRCLNGTKNNEHWENIVGYSLLSLKKHLEQKFQPGMNWDNYGKWHIDHIYPVSLFNITSYKCEDFKKCWSLNNLQPLWEKENKQKYNKIIQSH